MTYTVPYTVPWGKTNAASIAALPRPNDGALGLTRTADTRFRKPLLYPLSYEGTPSRSSRAVPTIPAAPRPR
jgi:hypothetical protein